MLDVAGPREPVVWGQSRPELDKLQLEKSARHNNIGDRPDLNSSAPVAEGEMRHGNGWQTVKLDKQATGRYVAMECLSTHDDKPCAVAELYLRDANGKRIDRNAWTVKYADSENLLGNHTGDKAFDLQESTYWQTEADAAMPHLLVIDLGAPRTVSALEYLPRAEQGAPGSVKGFRMHVFGE